MDLIKTICRLIIGISLISVFYLSYNYTKFMNMVGFYFIGKWVKETIGFFTFLSIFFLIISFTIGVMLKIKE